MDTTEGEKLSRDLGRSQRGKENKREPPSGAEPSAAARPSSTKPGPGQRRRSSAEYITVSMEADDAAHTESASSTLTAFRKETFKSASDKPASEQSSTERSPTETYTGMDSVSSKSIRKNPRKASISATPVENTVADLSSHYQESSTHSASSCRGTSKKAKDALTTLNRPSSAIDRPTSSASEKCSSASASTLRGNTGRARSKLSSSSSSSPLSTRQEEVKREECMSSSAPKSMHNAPRGGARPKLSSLSTGQEEIGGEALGSTFALTSPRQDDIVGLESGLSSTTTSTSKTGCGTRGIISSPTTSTLQNKVVENEIIPSSKSASTTRQKRRPISSESFRQKETREDRPPQSSLPTLTRQEDTTNGERETGAVEPSTSSTASTASAAKKSEIRVRAKLSSASKSTSLGDRGEDRQDFSSATKSPTPEGIAVEDLEENSASTQTERKKGRGAKAKRSSPPSSTRQDETEGRLEMSSCSTLQSPKDDCLEMPEISLSLTLKATDPLEQAKHSFKDASATQKSRKERLQRSYSLLSAREGDTGGEAGARAKLSSESPSAGQERSAAGNCDGSRTPALAREDSLTTPRRRKLDELKLIKEAEEVMRKAGIEISANPTRQGNDFFDEEVKLEKKEKLHALSQCTSLRENILESLNTGSAWRWEVFNSGSSYDGTKVARSDEMDFMFVPVNITTGWMEVVLDGAPSGFCFLRLRDPRVNDTRYTALKQLCDDDRMFIKAASFKENTFKLFRTGIKNTRNAEAGRASAAGAALPAKYHVIPRPDGQGLDPISLDLVPALHFTAWPQELTDILSKLPDNVREDVEKAGFHVVPKQYPGAGFKDDRDFLWRLSFSAAEKQMTKFADGKHRDPTSKVLTTCRKHVLRMVKRILEIAKDVDNSRNRRLCPSVEELMKAVRTLREQRCVDVTCFSTFQIRTLLWDDFYIRLPADEHWERSIWRTRLQETLGNLKYMLTGEKRVSHFFVPEMNIVELVPMKEKEFLYIIFLIAEKIF